MAPRAGLVHRGGAKGGLPAAGISQALKDLGGNPGGELLEHDTARQRLEGGGGAQVCRCCWRRAKNDTSDLKLKTNQLSLNSVLALSLSVPVHTPVLS